MDNNDVAIVIQVLRRFCEDDFWNCVILDSDSLTLDGRVDLQDYEVEAIKRLGLIPSEE